MAITFDDHSVTITGNKNGESFTPTDIINADSTAGTIAHNVVNFNKDIILKGKYTDSNHIIFFEAGKFYRVREEVDWISGAEINGTATRGAWIISKDEDMKMTVNADHSYTGKIYWRDIKFLNTGGNRTEFMLRAIDIVADIDGLSVTNTSGGKGAHGVFVWKIGGMVKNVKNHITNGNGPYFQPGSSIENISFKDDGFVFQPSDNNLTYTGIDFSTLTQIKGAMHVISPTADLYITIFKNVANYPAVFNPATYFFIYSLGRTSEWHIVSELQWSLYNIDASDLVEARCIITRTRDNFPLFHSDVTDNEINTDISSYVIYRKNADYGVDSVDEVLKETLKFFNKHK